MGERPIHIITANPINAAIVSSASRDETCTHMFHFSKQRGVWFQSLKYKEYLECKYDVIIF